MKIEVSLTHSAIDQLPRPEELFEGHSGAWVEFTGIVRSGEDGRTIEALEYEAYEAMAPRVMREILEALRSQHPCLLARVVHRIGRVPVGQAAIRLGVAATHRAEAFALATEFMDRLKQDVPIWKRTTAPPDRRALATHVSDRKALSIEDTLAIICRRSQPLDDEPVALELAAGRILREAVCADQDSPGFDRSAMDGYAIGLNDDSETFRVVDHIRAGEFKPRVLQRGQAVGIATGAALPGEGLRVVVKERALANGGTVRLDRSDRERNVRFRGEDFKSGDLLVAAGTRLTPGVLTLLASVGCNHPVVNRTPRTIHLVTGNELVTCDHRPGPGQVRDSNSILVRAFLAEHNIEPVQVRVAEHREALATALQSLPWPQESADLVIISGGASVGDHDHSAAWLETLGFALEVQRVKARPGRPLLFGTRDRAVAFGLPGNPLAHFVCLNLYVREALRRLAGDKRPLAFCEGRLVGPSRNGGPSAHDTLAPARFEILDGRSVVTPLPWRSSADLASLATANALVRIPAGADASAEGTRVQFLVI